MRQRKGDFSGEAYKNNLSLSVGSLMYLYGFRFVDLFCSCCYCCQTYLPRLRARLQNVPHHLPKMKKKKQKQT